LQRNFHLAAAGEICPSEDEAYVRMLRDHTWHGFEQDVMTFVPQQVPDHADNAAASKGWIEINSWARPPLEHMLVDAVIDVRRSGWIQSLRVYEISAVGRG